MKIMNKFCRTTVGAMFIIFLSCNMASAAVYTYIGCNSGSVSASAWGSAYSPFGEIEMDLWVTGPDYTSYQSVYGHGSVGLSGSTSFQWDSYYTATACAVYEDDNGWFYECDTATCVTPIEPTGLNLMDMQDVSGSALRKTISSNRTITRDVFNR